MDKQIKPPTLALSGALHDNFGIAHHPTEASKNNEATRWERYNQDQTIVATQCLSLLLHLEVEVSVFAHHHESERNNSECWATYNTLNHSPFSEIRMLQNPFLCSEPLDTGGKMRVDLTIVFVLIHDVWAFELSFVISLLVLWLAWPRPFLIVFRFIPSQPKYS